MQFTQDLIHKLEEGAGFRYLRIGLGCLAVIGLTVWYNSRSFHNLSTQEGMDAAQVARNLAEGRGYTTDYLRPFSLYLVRNHAGAAAAADPRQDSAKVRQSHPDLANPPVYPVALAGLMKVLPFRYDVDITHPFWSIPPIRTGLPRQFWRYQPDFLIGVFNQLLFFAAVAQVFFLTRRLFDRTVAWTSAVLLLGCEQLWRFSMSGLSTMLLLVIFMGVIWCLVRLEASVREEGTSQGRIVPFAVVAGLLMGLGTLTRYSFGWLIVPLVIFLILFGGTRRVVFCLAVAGVFLLTLSPWIYRNWQVCGAPFGTAGYAIVEGTAGFSENQLARSLNPDFQQVSVWSFIYKLLANSRLMFQNDLPKLGGTWAAPFFLVGLLLGFNNLAIRRLRYFLMGALVTLFVTQALGRTQLSEDSPDINSENLLVLLVPLVVVYGVSLFYLLLDQMKLLFQGLRYIVIGVFGFVMCLPMIFTFLPPGQSPLSYPPYYPPVIQQTAVWMKSNEMMMSDIPWAVAWYGRRQCIWLTQNADSEFFALNDSIKPVRALYLTAQTLKDKNALALRWRDDEIMRTQKRNEGSWNWFAVEVSVNRQVPKSFPLRVGANGFLPEQLFITDWERWKKSAEEPNP